MTQEAQAALAVADFHLSEIADELDEFGGTRPEDVNTVEAEATKWKSKS